MNNSSRSESGFAAVGVLLIGAFVAASVLGGGAAVRSLESATNTRSTVTSDVSNAALAMSSAELDGPAWVGTHQLTLTATSTLNTGDVVVVSPGDSLTLVTSPAGFCIIGRMTTGGAPMYFASDMSTVRSAPSGLCA